MTSSYEMRILVSMLESKIPIHNSGAGSTLAEMRGDMPGNYFSWMLRYPEPDDVIIVLRNVYGPRSGLKEFFK